MPQYVAPTGFEPIRPDSKSGVLPITQQGNLSEKQDSNLRPPASKAGKQPPLSSQLCNTDLFRENAKRQSAFSLSSSAVVEAIGLEPIRPFRRPDLQSGEPTNCSTLPFETRVRIELTQNGFAIRCLNHSASLSMYCGE